MDTSYWKLGVLLKLPKPTLLAGALLALASVALACAPAEDPNATSAPAAVVEEEAMEEEVAAIEEEAMEEEVAAAESTTGGEYVERAGLRLFIPEGYLFGGGVIPPDPREPRYGGSFAYGDSRDPPNLDPYFTTASNATRTLALINERLVHWPTAPGTDRYDFANQFQPGLAESWEVSDDFLTYTFHLRQGVKFHNVPPINGRELTADDVVYTAELMGSEGSINIGYFKPIDRVEATDRYTVVFRLKEFTPGFFPQRSDPGRGFILPRGSDDINRKLTAVGTGPFIAVGDYQYKVGMSLRRNPDYWAKDERGQAMPYLDGYRIVVIGDQAARSAAFRTGKIDQGISLGNPEEVTALLRTNPNTLIQELGGANASQTAIGMRLDKEPFSDVRVRRALSLAIDYDLWTRTLYGLVGGYTHAASGIWIGEPDTLESLTARCECPWYSYDPEQAKQLLAEAGFAPGQLEFTVQYYVYNIQHTETHELLSSFWNDVGIKSKLQAVDYTVFRSDMERGAFTDVSGWTFAWPIPSDSDTTVDNLTPGGGANSNLGWVNDEVINDLVPQYHAAFGDEATRTDLYGQIRARVLDQVYVLLWARGHSFQALAPRIRNFQPTNVALGSNDARQYIHAWVDDTYSFVR